MLKRSVLGAGVLLLSFVSGCSDGKTNELTGPEATGGTGTAGRGGKPGKIDADNLGGEAGMGGTGGCGPDGCTLPPDLGRLSSLMRRATSCDDLSEQLRSELRNRIEADIARQNTGGSGGSGFPNPGPGGGSGGAWQGSGGGTGSGTAGASSSGGSGSGGPVYTGTNTQIPNVDEPDFVKTDGKHLYVLQAGMLRVATAYPAASMAELTSAPIEGFAREMFLAQGANDDEKRVVIYSEVNSALISGAAGAVAPGEQYNPFIKVTLLTFGEGVLSTEAEYYFEGSYVSARRTDNRVRQVLNVGRGYPAGLKTWATDADNRKAELLVLEQLGAENRSVADLTSAQLDELFKKALIDVLASENETALQAVKGEDWVPKAFIRRGAELVPANIACEDVYIPESGTLDASITYVPEFNVDQPTIPPRGAALLGGSQTLYQNQNELVIASPPNHSFDADGAVRTYLHVFDVDAKEPLAYRASGVVDGSVAGQFALDEQGGAFRAVTSIWDATGPSTRLFSLAVEDTDLNVVGETDAIAPGETLRSVRFVGDTAYVVTFRNVDPLFVIDLTDPEQPTELAELEIPGFSQYMHPIGDTHLLTIGQTGDFDANVMLRLFDVSNKAVPVASFVHEFAKWGSSDAQLDHRAFTFFADRGLLAIPFSGYVWDWDNDYSYWGTYLNKMALINVDTGSGFRELGSIDGSGLLTALSEAGSCSWNLDYDSRFERGTFIGDTLYAIARHGIVAANVATPETTIATLPLGTSCDDGGSGGSGGSGGWGGSGGSAGSAGSGGNGFGGVPTMGGAPSGGSGQTTGGFGGTSGSTAGSGGSAN